MCILIVSIYEKTVDLYRYLYYNFIFVISFTEIPKIANTQATAGSDEGGGGAGGGRGK